MHGHGQKFLTMTIAKISTCHGHGQCFTPPDYKIATSYDVWQTIHSDYKIRYLTFLYQLPKLESGHSYGTSGKEGEPGGSGKCGCICLFVLVVGHI